MKLPFLDVGATYVELRDDLDAAYRRVMTSGRYLLGGELEAFEHEYATAAGARHCIGVGSGLDALTLALRALEVGPGDEVVVPANTYVATWLAVSSVGATIVAVEPQLATHNLDPDAFAAAVTSRTRAVVPVHLYGRPAGMDRITAVASRHGVAVLADAAQAHGATFQGRPIGGLGDVVAWSFYPGKNLGAFADAGAVTTDDPHLAERIRVLRNYGSAVKYENQVKGVNSRMDELQAAFLRVKLPHLHEWNERRRTLASAYHEHLASAGLIALPPVDDGCRSSWHLYVVRADRRDDTVRALAAWGIEALVHYPIAPYAQQAYAEMGIHAGTFPISDRLSQEVLSLPIGPHLPPEAARRVAEALAQIRSDR